MQIKEHKSAIAQRIILVGKGGSGKDHLRKILEELGFRYCVSHTSRPKRSSEVNGVDYFFVDGVFFNDNPDLFYEKVSFNGWYYGTSKVEFTKSNLLIMTPSGISKLTPDDRNSSLIVYIDIDEKIRRERLSKRGDADNVDRRMESDRSDFTSFEDYDVRISNPFFDLDYIKEKISIL